MLFLTIFSKAQNITFTDPIFKAKLIAGGSTPGFSAIAGSGWFNNSPINYIDIDTNHDYQISIAEAAEVTYLYLQGLNLTNLGGIEYFVNLRELTCGYNYNLTSFNATTLTFLTKLSVNRTQVGNIDVSTLTNLKSLVCGYSLRTQLNINSLSNLVALFCDHNQISILDLSNNSSLEFLSCKNNQISQLNFANKPSFTSLYCDNNLLTSLDFSNNPLFENLSCQSNNLTSLKIKNGRQQMFGANMYDIEDWSNNPNLNYICADDFEIPGLQSYLLANYLYQPMTINSACALSTTTFDSQAISVSPNPTKSIVIITFKEFLSEKGSYEVYNVLGQKVIANGVQSGINNFDINLENYANGLYLLQITIGDKKFNKSLIKQ